MLRPVVLLLSAGAVMWGASSQTDVLTLVNKSCVACHNAKMKSGDLDLKSRTAASDTFVHDRDVWERVAEKIQTRQMPPPPLPQPPDDLRSATLDFLRQEFARQDQLIKPEPGRVSMRPAAFRSA